MQSVQVSVTDACRCLSCSLSYIYYIIQASGGLDHDLRSNGYSDINSAGPFPSMNYVNAPPPTRYTNSTGYDDPTHLATVSVHLRSSCPLC